MALWGMAGRVLRNKIEALWKAIWRHYEYPPERNPNGMQRGGVNMLVLLQSQLFDIWEHVTFTKAL